MAKATFTATMDRDRLLTALEAVRPCVAAQETVPQAHRFVFKDGNVYSFDDEKSCRGPSGLHKDFAGAVDPTKFVDLLKRLTDETVKVSVVGGELRVRGKGTSAFAVDPEIRLPISAVDVPEWGEDSGVWHSLPDEFCEAVGRVAKAAGKDEAQFVLTCVNLTSGWAEACDGLQCARWSWDMPLSRPMLLRKDAAEAAAALGVTHYAQTNDWLHFRSGRGFVLSCRRIGDEYPSARLTGLFALSGERLELPAGLAEAAVRAGLFSSEVLDRSDDVVEVAITHTQIVVTGRGRTDWHTEPIPANWSGPECCFMISPDMLKDVARAHSDASVCYKGESPECLKVEAGAYAYITRLMTVDGGTVGGDDGGQE